MGHMGDDWNQQQNERRGNQYGKVMLIPLRDMEFGENPAWTKINFHRKACFKNSSGPGADCMISQ